MNTNYKTPGQLLNHLLEQRGWSQRVLAVVLGMGETTVNKLATDKRRFTAEIALNLEEIFGEPMDSFLDLQKAYDKAVAKARARPNPDQVLRMRLFSELPISEMIKRGWIDAKSVKDFAGVEAGLCSFFGVSKVEDIEVLPHAAKKTEVATGTSSAQLAWLYRVKKIASEMVIPRYSKKAGKAAVDQLLPLRVSVEAIRKVPRILAKAGIRFVIVESLPSAKIDGVCFWLDESAPVIGMSLRFDRIDNFWFVLRHELEHVLREHGKSSISIDTELADERAGTGDDLAEEERVANSAAANFAVPKSKMDGFIARKAPLFTDRNLIGFARTLGVHPGLVTGQLQYRAGQYKLFRNHLVKIRSSISPSALVDGWGDIVSVDS